MSSCPVTHLFQVLNYSTWRRDPTREDEEGIKMREREREKERKGGMKERERGGRERGEREGEREGERGREREGVGDVKYFIHLLS